MSELSSMIERIRVFADHPSSFTTIDSTLARRIICEMELMMQRTKSLHEDCMRLDSLVKTVVKERDTARNSAFTDAAVVVHRYSLANCENDNVVALLTQLANEIEGMK